MPSNAQPVPANAARELAERWTDDVRAHVVDLKQAAALTGFSIDTISRAISNGSLDAGRPNGHRYRISILTLATWVLSGA